MTYTGNVMVGGPADVRELAGLTLTKVAVGRFDNNCYLLRCTSTGTQALVDAAADPDTLLKLCDGNLSAVITTHQHGDHWQALQPVVAATGATTYAGRDDVDGIPVRTQVPVDDGDAIRFGDVELTAIHLVGHTPGSIALLYNDPSGHPHLMTGDCLFPGGVGNTHNDPERFESLLRDVTTKIFGTLPDETWVYPGHGNDTTLGAERPHLDEWRARGW
jgi:glyoxylase-like metal-dependent hydrolase (beta-lactamase superfamily II)